MSQAQSGDLAQMSLTTLSSVRQITLSDDLVDLIAYDFEKPTPNPPYTSWYREPEHSEVVLGGANLEEIERYECISTSSIIDAESSNRVTMKEEVIDSLGASSIGSRLQLVPDQHSGIPLVRVVPAQEARSILLESITS